MLISKKTEKAIKQCWYLIMTRFVKKGINMLCEEWLDFQVFRQWCIDKGFNEKSGIRKIDLRGIFSPSNTYISPKRVPKPLTIEQKIKQLFNAKIKVIIKSKFGVQDNLDRFETFLEWATPKFTDGCVIRRLDENKPYSKENCVLCQPEEAKVVKSSSPKTSHNRKKQNLRNEAIACLRYINIKVREGKATIDSSWSDKEVFYKWYTQNYKEGKLLSKDQKHYGPSTCYFYKANPDLPKNEEKLYRKIYQVWGRLRTKLCEEWQDPFVFYQWFKVNVKQGLIFTRIDKASPFSPSNATFAKKSEMDHSENVEKGKRTCLERYGVERVSQTEDVKNKVKQTMMDKYGVPSVFHLSNTPEKRIASRQNFAILKKKSYRGTSKLQKQIEEYIQSLSFETRPDYAILNDGKELDIFIEPKMLAIEFCGLFWHTEGSKSIRGKSYHYNKYKACTDKKVSLLTIFSDEWVGRQAQVKGYIAAKLGKSSKTIFARKCSVEQIEGKMALDFINANHIQKLSKFPMVAFGLKHDGVLVGVMTLDKHHRGKNELVLNRFAVSIGTHIPGGASKLFSRCAKWAKEAGFETIQSWSDNRWSNGIVYEKLGFTKVKENPPDYSYVNLNSPGKRISKQSLYKKGESKEKLKQMGIARIWDCGKIKWSYKL